MIYCEIDRQKICKILMFMVTLFTAIASNATGESPAEAVRKLNSPIRYERVHAVFVLKQADPNIVLEQFKRGFQILYHESRVAFTEKVLPNLDGEQVDHFFLKELREGFEVHLEFLELAKRVERDEQAYRYLELGKKLYESNQWWQWVVLSKRDLDYVPSYDEIWRMFIKLNKRGFPLDCFARALHRLDSNRAKKDFENLLFEPDHLMKLRGIWALEAIRFVPKYEVISKYFKNEDINLLDQSDQYVLILERKDLELLLFLLVNPSSRVSNMAEYRLGQISYMTQHEIDSIILNVATPQQRVDVWHGWWDQHKDYSEQRLCKRAVSVLVEQSRQQLTKKMLDELAKYPEQDEVYPFFRKAIFSNNKELQIKALERLSYIATQKRNDIAVNIIVDFCKKLTPEEYGDYTVYLVKVEDERVRSLLLTMLETQRGQDLTWRRKLARSIGMTGQKWALDPLVRMIIEDGSSNAAGVITLVEGSERAIPRLLDALVKQEDHLKRYPIAEAIRTIGAEDLHERLTEILTKSKKQSASMSKGGVRFDILTLMESFPDPNAKPLLLELLQSENPWDHLGAARVLGKLGDDSGVEVLIGHIKRTTNISASFFNNRIGDALFLIGSPKTKKLLERHFQQGDLDIKKLTLHVMAQQLDPAYISFMEKCLESSELEPVKAARREIGYLINAKLHYEKEKQQSDDFEIDILKEDDLPPIRFMLLWAFFGAEVNDKDETFPNSRSLINLKGAVIRLNRFQKIEFNKSNKSITLSTANQQALITRDGTKAGRQQPYAEGYIKRLILNEYMIIFLHLNYGGASYLFKNDGKEWKVIGYVGGVIE